DDSRKPAISATGNRVRLVQESQRSGAFRGQNRRDTGKTTHGQSGLGSEDLKLLLANTVRFEQRTSKRYQSPILQPDSRKGDNLHPGHSLNGILIHVLRRNEQAYGAAPLEQLRRNSQAGKKMPPSASTSQGDDRWKLSQTARVIVLNFIH